MASDHREAGRRTPILVSACLLGLATRYDGKAKGSRKVLDYLEREQLLPIPVCPEQLAGMSTPRGKTFFACGDGHDVLSGAGRVVSATGQPMDEIFRRGADMTLQVARLCQCRLALLKERSPSCGVHQVYRGEERVPGVGVATALLIREGFSVISEEDV